jgi:hypothetical protein
MSKTDIVARYERDKARHEWHRAELTAIRQLHERNRDRLARHKDELRAVEAILGGVELRECIGARLARHKADLARTREEGCNTRPLFSRCMRLRALSR